MLNCEYEYNDNVIEYMIMNIKVIGIRIGIGIVNEMILILILNGLFTLKVGYFVVVQSVHPFLKIHRWY